MGFEDRNGYGNATFARVTGAWLWQPMSDRYSVCQARVFMRAEGYQEEKSPKKKREFDNMIHQWHLLTLQLPKGFPSDLLQCNHANPANLGIEPGLKSWLAGCMYPSMYGHMYVCVGHLCPASNAVANGV